MQKHRLHQAIALSSAIISSGFSTLTYAQEMRQMEEIVVSARRREELLQDVPISMTVMSQQQMENANITNAGDLALYTPSLSTNKRFGDDLTSFSIRGFTQELRTTASVGVYFADVVAPRGSASQTSGDGAGPGMMFDLENVQVLKGPQGTLFGRNTTGGAVLLVPKKPTTEQEGYIEATTGNYDLKQFQGVFNLPASDRVRMRFGVDTKKRDGYLNNVSGIGPDAFGDVDYIAARASLVIDVSDSVENYTILSYTDSENNGSHAKVTDCNTTAKGGGLFGGLIGDMCQSQLDRMQAGGHDDFWDVAQNMPQPVSKMKDWRVINTTQWEISDALTLKNIVSYAELNTVNNSPIWATDYRFIPYANTSTSLPFNFAISGVRGDGVDVTDSSTLVEELQLQGNALDDTLIWQVGAYYEKTRPIGKMGQASSSLVSCDLSTLGRADPNQWRCNDVLSGLGMLNSAITGAIPFAAYLNPTAYPDVYSRVGSVSVTTDEVEYLNKAIYAQTTYDFTDQWSLTAGIRYTWDQTDGRQDRLIYQFPYDPLYGQWFAPDHVIVSPTKSDVQKSKAPTWLLGIDYKPTDETLLYAKYSRGYRQGSVNVSSQPDLLVYDPEKVDTYELGSKISFSGNLPGFFNTAIFYNDFQDQQLSNGLILSPEHGGVGSVAIVNAGASTIWGVEVDAGVELFEGFTLSASYAYLNTEVKEIEDVNAKILASGAKPSVLSAIKGDELPFSPQHSATLSAQYQLPVDDSLGDLIVGATYVYTDEMRVASSENYSPLSVLPSFNLLNLNVNWLDVARSGVDLSLFANNVTNEEYYGYATGNYSALENETALPGQPRMYGLRMRYNF